MEETLIIDYLKSINRWDDNYKISWINEESTNINVDIKILGCSIHNTIKISISYLYLLSFIYSKNKQIL